jgi:ribosomal protein S18 acetylase RimI-like enzyme
MTKKITSVLPEEAHLVRSLIREIASKELGFSKKSLNHYIENLTDEEIARRVRDNRYLLLAAREERELIGVVIGTPPEGGVGTIQWLLIVPSSRGEGVGRRLFEAACGRFRSLGCHKIKLTAPNQKAVKFYEKQGMKVEGFHPDHWWHRDFWSLGKKLQL